MSVLLWTFGYATDLPQDLDGKNSCARQQLNTRCMSTPWEHVLTRSKSALPLIPMERYLGAVSSVETRVAVGIISNAANHSLTSPSRSYTEEFATTISLRYIHGRHN